MRKLPRIEGRTFMKVLAFLFSIIFIANGTLVAFIHRFGLQLVYSLLHPPFFSFLRAPLAVSQAATAVAAGEEEETQRRDQQESQRLFLQSVSQ